jgi:FAD/FMN-containing dehydrogenase
MLDRMGAWAARIAPSLSRHVELTLLVAAAPPAMSDRCRSSNGFACVVSGTAFVDSSQEAAAALSLLDTCPGEMRLHADRNLPTPIALLHDMGAMGLPEGHRFLGDTLWTNSPPIEVLGTLRDHFMGASAKCSALFVFSTGEDPSPFPDAAYSMRGDALLLCYAVWERAEDDAANAAWHRAAIAALDKYAVGHYVGECDIVADPGRAERSYSKTNWERLQKLRQHYDPEGLFHSHFGAR